MHPCHFVFISLIADPIEVHTAKATMSSCTAFLVRLAAVAVCCGANAADVQVINGSLARQAIKDLESRGAIRVVSVHSSQLIYTRATNA
ncbi:hypothetical protein OsI_35153 [Oryza sativa Indica Group]|uniref:40S ribosomal protein S25 n=1 Tax=Oryza sativa subsp. indica TaxID=39946 RepID=B8BJ58_ORYSI|nr:hypothetical protein OsI_35153 [Oryza sativa Indica Group]